MVSRLAILFVVLASLLPMAGGGLGPMPCRVLPEAADASCCAAGTQDGAEECCDDGASAQVGCAPRQSAVTHCEPTDPLCRLICSVFCRADRPAPVKAEASKGASSQHESCYPAPVRRMVAKVPQERPVAALAANVGERLARWCVWTT